ncbi:MAG TPA: hypothetical protein PLX06_05505 [Fimbriimonadaceae bacterium]|nr:hypothetical protein [Fimbriimonadaceae bacterium]
MKNFLVFVMLLTMVCLLMGCGEPEAGAGNTNVAPEVEKADPATPQGTATQADVRTD